jgi:hypothetical protein
MTFQRKGAKWRGDDPEKGLLAGLTENAITQNRRGNMHRLLFLAA